MHLVTRTRAVRRTSRVFRRSSWMEAEALESRELLTVDLSSLIAVPAISSAATTSSISGLTPSQIAKAYNFPTTSNGVPLGTGQTIAIVDAYNDPNIATDLANFSKQFGLPAAQLSVVNQNGGSTLPAADAGWAEEIALDVEWAHAVAPGAKILLVEASSAGLSDLLTAVKTAAKSANVVSMSWGGSEFWGENQFDSVFNVPGVTFVASAGDTPGVSWPAVSPNVVGVGGTTLSLSSTGGYGSESIWHSTGGGVSQFEPQPSYQATFSGLLGVPARVTPDVGYDANPSSGVAVLDTYQNPYSASGWIQVGGTSAGSPQWAGIFADANSLRSTPLSSSTALAALYSLANNPTSASNDFHSVTTGGSYFLNTVTGTKFSLGAGLGTPNVSNLIAALTGATSTSTATGSTTSTGSNTGTGTKGSGNTGGGNTGGTTTGTGGKTRHAVDTSMTTTVTVTVTTTPTTAGGSLGAVTDTSAAATAATGSGNAQAAATASSVATTASSSLARPVQPVTSNTPRFFAPSSYEPVKAEPEAVPEANDAMDEAAQPPAAAPGGPKEEAVPEDQAPKSDKNDERKSKPQDEAPIESSYLLDSWDDVLADFASPETIALIPVPVERAMSPTEDQGSSGRQSAFAAGAAVFLWTSWELRSRLNDRRSRLAFARTRNS